MPHLKTVLTRKIKSKQDESVKIPRFPYNSRPRDYQQMAYKNWITNGYTGIFAMATGTGKTITALNCILEEYNKSGIYQVLIIVPTLALVEQWKREISLFNFKNIYEVSGNANWRESLTKVKNNFLWNVPQNFFIITTYLSFSDQLFQKLYKQFSKEVILVADEAHNIGAPKVKEAFRSLPFAKRIALSATPKRVYDPEGTKEIEYFFNDVPPYIYNFSMREAIDQGFLSKYYYYPRIIRLTDEEYDRYIIISKKLLKYFDSGSNELLKCEEVERLLLIRKQIIHKAVNKLLLFRDILLEVLKKRELKYCFVYVPEGYGIQEDGIKFSYINKLVDILHEESPTTRSNTYLGGDQLRSDKLKAFASGKIDVLFAMKCLDEGVDVPRAEIGIFASSTGNPRQFIQRRGRLLRKSPNKKFAYIYDMIVIPKLLMKSESEFYKLERSLVKNELTRVAYFASLSENFYESKIGLEEVSKFYNLDIDLILNEL